MLIGGNAGTYIAIYLPAAVGNLSNRASTGISVNCTHEMSVTLGNTVHYKSSTSTVKTFILVINTTSILYTLHTL
jgi:hypothetical protein